MKQKINKVFSWITYCFIFITAIFTIFSIAFKQNSNDGVTIFNHKMMIVETESMEKSDLVDVSNYDIKSIKKNSLIFIEVVDEDNPYEFYKNLNKYDVVTFKYMIANRQVIITHRIIEIEEYDDGFVFILQGDNINEDGTTSTQMIDTRDSNSFNYIIGKVKGVSYLPGLIITALKSPAGLIGMIIIPCLLLIILEVIKIVNEINKDKIKKSLNKDLELENKNQELLELRKRLEELEKKDSEKEKIETEETNNEEIEKKEGINNEKE